MLYSLHGIQKRNGTRLALDIPNLHIAPGGIYILQGTNGAGKTTLLNILGFLAAPSSGEIVYRGRRLDFRRNDWHRLRKEVTLLHQSPYLFDGSVYDNVAFGLKVRGINGSEQQRIANDALDMVGLAGFEKRAARLLSGGEIQRVGLARALAVKPQVLLLDEPLSNVDGESAQSIERVIKALPGSGTTVILASHDQLLPKRLGAEVFRLLAGRLSEGQSNNPFHLGDKCYANI